MEPDLVQRLEEFLKLDFSPSLDLFEIGIATGLLANNTPRAVATMINTLRAREMDDLTASVKRVRADLFPEPDSDFKP